MAVGVKICGLSTPATIDVAVDAGADFVGLVFFPPSPRYVSLDAAAKLADRARGKSQIVALSVDADDAVLDAISAKVRPDWFQLHGQETPERVEAIRARYGKPVIKAIKVAQASDVARADGYVDVADMLLYDAKAPRDAILPGGNGAVFDWALLRAAPRVPPMMLAGGLNAGNMAEAIRVAAPDMVDVSSGVESAPGVKDPQMIRQVIAAVRQAANRDEVRTDSGA